MPRRSRKLCHRKPGIGLTARASLHGPASAACSRGGGVGGVQQLRVWWLLLLMEPSWNRLAAREREELLSFLKGCCSALVAEAAAFSFAAGLSLGPMEDVAAGSNKRPGLREGSKHWAVRRIGWERRLSFQAQEYARCGDSSLV